MSTEASGGLVGKRIDKQHSFQNRTQEFNLRELRAASKNFSQKIGEGGFGPVYYGKLANGQEVAIKVSNGISKQGQSEFFTEVLRELPLSQFCTKKCYSGFFGLGTHFLQSCLNDVVKIVYTRF